MKTKFIFHGSRVMVKMFILGVVLTLGISVSLAVDSTTSKWSIGNNWLFINDVGGGKTDVGISSLAGASNRCLYADKDGILRTTDAACGSGGGETKEVVNNVQDGIWQKNETDSTKIFYNNGNVGIGTNDPGTWKLAVMGTQYVSGNIETGDNMILGGSNQWIFHTPDDGRTSMYIAPWTGKDWGWGVMTFLQNGNVGIGTTNPNAYKLHVGGDIFADGGWLRVSGNRGLYWENHDGGWYMSDPTWVRSYKDKHIYTGGVMRADGGFTIGDNTVIDAGGGWHRTYGNTGWYNGTYGGGWYMEDSTWIRACNNKHIYTGGVMRADGGFTIGDNTVIDAGGGWHRTYGNTGWYNGTYGGGWYMEDSTWIRAYNNKHIYTAGTVQAGAFQYNSDQRLKQNIQPIKSALEKVKNLSGVSFDWKKDGRKSIGFIAQDVEKVFPEIVHTDSSKDQMKSVEYGNITAVLVEAIKEQQKQIEELREKVRMLED